MDVEYGSTGNVRWPPPENIKMYDSEGKEVKIPTCMICGTHKCLIQGAFASAFICVMGCKETPDINDWSLDQYDENHHD